MHIYSPYWPNSTSAGPTSSSSSCLLASSHYKPRPSSSRCGRTTARSAPSCWRARPRRPPRTRSARIAACPVVVATPRPLLALVKHLAGTERLHSRRAIATSGGESLVPLATRLKAIVLDEADALLLDRELALVAPKRKGYSVISGGGGDVKAPERFTKPTAKAVQALLKARSAEKHMGGTRRQDAVAVGVAGGGRGRRGGRGGRGGGGVDADSVQLVACSATASYRLREELCRLFDIETESGLKIITSEDGKAASKKAAEKKRATGQRGIGGIGVPQTIIHSWVSCDHDGEKPAAVAATLRALSPKCALLFLADDAPLRSTVTELQNKGIDAQMLHEAMGLGPSTTLASRTALATGEEPPSADGYAALESSLLEGDDAEDQRCRVLVSTHSSARGLDIATVECVLLYSLPASADTYLHLAGRTGRQGRDGSVVSLLSPDEAGSIGTITRQLGLSIKQNAKVALELADYRAVTGLTQPEEAEPSVDEVLPLDLSVDKPSAAFGDGWEKF